tara:strand:+ start:1145 stop:1396 length:252 start_codon:yes stop_codon:yes gene_type:complete
MKNNLISISKELMVKIKSFEGFNTPLLEEEIIRSLSTELDAVTSEDKEERIKALHNMFALGQVFSKIREQSEMKPAVDANKEK